jgi:aspartate 1-decarboxylase
MVLNGAAARLGSVGDRIIVMSFCWVDESDVHKGKHRPRILRLDEHNDPVGAPTSSVKGITMSSVSPN